MDALYSAMSAFVIMPWLAALPMFVFLALYGWSKRRSALAMGILWGAYGLYELGMYLLILCSGECNIRVDLLAIYPLLAALSLIVLVYAVMKGKRPTG